MTDGDEIDHGAQHLKVLQQRAADGVAEAQYQLGVMYHEGAGVEQDYVRAVHWYKQAAAQSHADALFNLAMLTGAGKGLTSDHTEAQRLLRHAVALGHEGANLALGHFGRIDEAAKRRMQGLELL